MRLVRAAVTIYHPKPFGRNPAAGTATAPGSAPTAPFNPFENQTTLTPPAPPQDQALAFTLSLPAVNTSVSGLSIMQRGSFFGFSIEMSIVTQICVVNIRIGGNTQDFATYAETLPNGDAIAKEKTNLSNPTLTPGVFFTKELLYIVSNISSLVNVKCSFFAITHESPAVGIPFNDTNWRLQIVEQGQAILGDKLLGFQAGNEPDYYLVHGHRSSPYGPSEYFQDFSNLIATIQNNPGIPVKNMLLGPSLASGPWSPEQVWATGYIDSFKDSLVAITVEQYFGVGKAVDPQQAFPRFLSHQLALDMVSPYRNSSNLARQVGKPFIMFETNTATCGGLPGISDSFGAALWAIDYGLTMAAANFSQSLWHLGGETPPASQSRFNQWTVGPIYYAALIAAEIFGKSNQVQVVDMTNNGLFTPSYAIYDNGILSKVALLNFMDDPSGGHDVTGTVTVTGGSVPPEVYVKYVGTLGERFTVDGRLRGDLSITKIQCDQGVNICRIPLKAPQFALVFFSDPSTTDAEQLPKTFTTTAYSTRKGINTAAVDPAVLATSNGLSGKDRSVPGSTSRHDLSNGAASLERLAVVASTLIALMTGGMLLIMTL
ncbi:hypothetical protein H0H92_014321 [Tricholoma furcatifolium]|nr:hypothetical protein H0H92_014321 [Tricholoma furcatifolium]